MAITFNRPVLYSFDPNTKEYRGETQPEICTLSLARNVLDFIAPAFTTEVAPPEVPRGSVALWNGSSWKIVADHRGETWWAGDQPVLVNDLSDPVAAGLTKDKPVKEPDHVDEKAVKRSALMAKLSEISGIGSSFVTLRQPVPQEWLDKHAELVRQLSEIDAGK